jgi:hypothetical protein
MAIDEERKSSIIFHFDAATILMGKAAGEQLPGQLHLLF